MENMKPELTCGVENHNPSCLCDVIIKTPTPVKVVIPFSYQYGPAIVEHFNLGVPWTSNDLAVFLQTLDKINEVKDQPHLWCPDVETQSQGEVMKKLTPHQLDYMKDLIRAGIKPRPVVAEMKERFNVDLHFSYVSKTKQRMTKRGEL